MDIKNNIKNLRNERNISQTTLANAIHVSQKAIDYWERGINEPKACYILALSLYFEVSADYLLGLEDEAGLLLLIVMIICLLMNNSF